jgi:hypothetical protein
LNDGKVLRALAIPAKRKAGAIGIVPPLMSKLKKSKLKTPHHRNPISSESIEIVVELV